MVNSWKNLFGIVYFYKPFPICLYYGNGKPNLVEKFFQDNIDELNFLLKNSLVINDKKFFITIHCFICDRPARAFMKCIKGHTGYFSCDRCTIKGEYYKNRVIFNSADSATVCSPRTNTYFRNFEQIEHHQNNHNSPLTTVNCIDMIDHFVLDSMQMVYLGVQKKLIND